LIRRHPEDEGWGKGRFGELIKIRAEMARDESTIFIADHVPSTDMTTTKTAVVCLDTGRVVDSSRPKASHSQITDFWVSSSAPPVGTEGNLDDVCVGCIFMPNPR